MAVNETSESAVSALPATEPEKRSAQKVWRYMDVPRFVSLVSTKSLYFACLSEFKDPFEGYLPKKHGEAFSEMLQPVVDQMMAVRDQVGATLSTDADRQEFNEQFAKGLSKLKSTTAIVRNKFGVSCWHKNQYESEAMWSSEASPQVSTRT
jgi:hypothetical protein